MPGSSPNTETVPMMLAGAVPTPEPSRSTTLLNGMSVPSVPTIDCAAPLGDTNASWESIIMIVFPSVRLLNDARFGVQKLVDDLNRDAVPSLARHAGSVLDAEQHVAITHPLDMQPVLAGTVDVPDGADARHRVIGRIGLGDARSALAESRRQIGS